MAQQHGSVRFHCGSTLADVPWLADVDAVVVATSPFTHHALISEALRLGKHVLTEKPFAMTREEARGLVARSEASKRVLGIVHNFQFARSTRRLVDDVAAGALGEVRGIVARTVRKPGPATSNVVRATAARPLL